MVLDHIRVVDLLRADHIRLPLDPRPDHRAVVIAEVAPDDLVPVVQALPADPPDHLADHRHQEVEDNQYSG
mgnify:CR=1 FL=1